MALSRWMGWARDMVRLVRGMPDEELRQKTLAIHEELIRLRRHRAAYEKEREAAALGDVRRIVDEMKGLERNLIEAEKATGEFVDVIAKQVETELQATLKSEMDLIGKTLTRDTVDLQKLAKSNSAALPNETK